MAKAPQKKIGIRPTPHDEGTIDISFKEVNGQGGQTVHVTWEELLDLKWEIQEYITHVESTREDLSSR